MSKLERVNDKMTQEQKEIVQFILEMLKVQLEQNNLYIGVLVDKKQPKKRKIVFLDKDSYRSGKNDGVVVELSELNGLK